MESKWKPRKASYLSALEYMKGRMKGEITSLKTPWAKFNGAGVDGIEWQSLVIISGRPGSLKSTIKDNIIQRAFDLNPGEKFRALDFQFEMIGRVTALREFSSATGRSYKHLCSADGKFNQEDLKACFEYAKVKADSSRYPVDVIDEPCTIEEFVEIVDSYMEAYKTPEGYTKTIISVDHSLLFLFKGTQQMMLEELGKALTILKKRYPIIFLVLSQLNRNIEQPGRQEEMKQGNYIITSDIFGSDSLLMHADMVIALNRPALSNIKWYGPNGFIIENDLVLVMHWLKVRSGDLRISFFRCDFSSMTIHETDPPPCKGDVNKKQGDREGNFRKMTPKETGELFLED